MGGEEHGRREERRIDEERMKITYAKRIECKSRQTKITEKRIERRALRP